jgi:hypothetical protein
MNRFCADSATYIAHQGRSPDYFRSCGPRCSLLGCIRTLLWLFGHVAIVHQHRHHDRYLSDGVHIQNTQTATARQFKRSSTSYPRRRDTGRSRAPGAAAPAHRALAPTVEEDVGTNDQRTRPPLRQGCECPIEISFGTRMQDMELDPEDVGRRPHEPSGGPVRMRDAASS